MNISTVNIYVMIRSTYSNVRFVRQQNEIEFHKTIKPRILMDKSCCMQRKYERTIRIMQTRKKGTCKETRTIRKEKRKRARARDVGRRGADRRGREAPRGKCWKKMDSGPPDVTWRQTGYRRGTRENFAAKNGRYSRIIRNTNTCW